VHTCLGVYKMAFFAKQAKTKVRQVSALILMLMLGSQLGPTRKKTRY